LNTVKNEKAVDSVYPYPSIIGQQSTTFIKSNILGLIGAAPVKHNL
jgi:hypothetical protein